MSYRQGHLDGFSIEERSACFRGTPFEMDPQDAEQLHIDGVVFMAVAVRVVAPKFDLKPDGLKRIDVFAVENARVLSGALREEIIDWLMSRAGQGTIDFKEKMGLEPDEPDDDPENDGEIIREPPSNVDVDTGEVSPPGEVETIEPEVFRPGSASPRAGDGPKTAKFSWDGESAPSSTDVQEVEQVGSVYGRERKDKQLASFLDGS